LTPEEIATILELMVADLGKRLAETHKVTIALDNDAKLALLTAGYDAKNGARPMKRAIQRLLEDPLAARIVDGRLQAGSAVAGASNGTALTIMRAAPLSAVTLAKANKGSAVTLTKHAADAQSGKPGSASEPGASPPSLSKHGQSLGQEPDASGTTRADPKTSP